MGYQESITSGSRLDGAMNTAGRAMQAVNPVGWMRQYPVTSGVLMLVAGVALGAAMARPAANMWRRDFSRYIMPRRHWWEIW